MPVGGQPETGGGFQGVDAFWMGARERLRTGAYIVTGAQVFLWWVKEVMNSD